MKNLLLPFIFLLGTTLQAQTVIEKSGNITTNETWSADTVKVTGEITVDNGITLTINPGVYVEFQGHYKLNVQGRILARGTAQNRITFTAKDTVLTDTSGGWHGIRFIDTPNTNDTSKIEFCIIQYGNGYGSDWLDGVGSALFVYNMNKLIVANNLITHNNNEAIYCYNASPLFEGNLIVKNYWTGVSCNNSSPKIINNTISDNGGYGINIFDSSFPEITNCIVSGNGYGNLYQDNSTPKITHCDIVGANLQADGNIDADPLFVGSGSNLYALQNTSPCLNTGRPDWDIDSLGINMDIAGNPRIYTGGTNPTIDMGAYERQSNPDPFLVFRTIGKKHIRFGSVYAEAIKPISFPSGITYTIIEAPSGLVIENDTIKWVPTLAQAETNYNLKIKVSNGVLFDTLHTEIYVLNSNEYFELPDEDVVWSADTIKVINNLTINNARTLTINPGVYVEFQGHYKLNVQGRILARGTAQNRITFTAKDSILTGTSGGWGGIRFYSTPSANDTSKIEFCIMQFGNAFGSDDWLDQFGSSLCVSNMNKLIVANSLFIRNRYYTIFCYHASPRIEGNLIVKNYYYSIYCDNSSPKITNNTISDNQDYGIYLVSSSPQLTNCIVSGNGDGNLAQYYSTPKITNCDIVGAHLQADGNMDINPLFVGSGANPYALQNTSPCLNTGRPDWDTDSLGINMDIAGNPRIYTFGSNPTIDMGAYELQSDPDPFLVFRTIGKKHIRFGSVYAEAIKPISFPSGVTYIIIEAPSGLAIENDTIKWVPTLAQAETNYNLKIKVSNGVLSDTLNTEIYVLNSNEYFVLPNEDVVWSADTIKVINNLTINNARTLTINPGVYVEFQGHYKLNVQGRILARGTVQNRITFTAKDSVLTDTSGGWGGIRFLETPSSNDTSKIEFCIIQFGNAFGSDGLDGHGGALCIYGFDKIKITNNLIAKNRSSSWNSAIYCNNASPLIEGNLMVKNYGNGINCYNSSPKITNNTISDNQGYCGISLQSSSPQLTNCIVSGNWQANLEQYNSTPIITNCDIVGANLQADGNIDVDPLFVVSGSNPYALQKTSPCLNSGRPDWDTDSLEINMDIAGNPRIYEGGTNPTIDMGAYELQSDPDSFLVFRTIRKKHIRFDSVYAEAIKPISFPSGVTYTIIEAPSGLSIENDTIKWVPTEAQAETNYHLKIKVSNGVLSDTLITEIYVLNSNEYFELPNEDVVWSADTIKVINNLTINNARTLTINPGVYVEFQGHYKLNVQGRILAQGTAQNRIIFTAKDSVLTYISGGWGGIRFLETPSSNDTSKIEFCIMQFGNAFGSYWLDGYGSALCVYNMNKLIVANNLITRNNNEAIYCYQASPRIEGNLIVKNYWIGISCDFSSPKITNNTISDNQVSGIQINYSLSEISNCIVSGNGQANLDPYNSTPKITNCDIVGAQLQADGNIDVDPLFVGSGANPYALQNTSPCINMGDPNFTNDSLITNYDFEGNERIQYGRIDIGAYEYQGPELYTYNQEIQINENQNNNQILDTVDAYYYGNGILEFSVFDGNDDNAIKLDSETGQISIIDSSYFNFERNDSLYAIIKIYDGSSSKLIGYNIKINDVNERVLTNNLQELIDENPLNNSIVDTILISDEDYNDTHVFSIVQANPSGAFGVVDSTGVIYVMDSSLINYEENQNFSLYVQVSDGEFVDTSFVNIQIDNVNELICNPYKQLEIEENLPNDSIIYQLEAFDEDNDALNYTIVSGNISNVFDLNSTTGAIQIKNTQYLSYELNKSFNLKILVSDGQLIDSVKVDIDLIDLNEKPHLSDLVLNIPENPNNSTILDTLVAADEDFNSKLTYSIIHASLDKVFGVIDSTGVVYVIDSTAINFEENKTFELLTLVSDGELSDTAAITINILNINESIEFLDTEFSVLENQQNGTIIGSVVASDLDGDVLAHAIISGNLYNTFAINASTGGISVNNNLFLDYEVNPSFNLQVVAFDGEFSDTATITINLIDVDETGINPFRGIPRSSAVSFTIDNTVYVGLGENADSVLSDFWKYNAGTDVWTKVAPFPGAARTEAVAFAVNGKGYVGLGGSKYPFTYYPDFYEYNPATNQWTTLGNFAGTARYDAVSFVINDTAYVGTGADAMDETKDFWKYDAVHDSWSEIATFTGAKRTSACAFVVEGKGYVSGGVNYSNGTSQSSDIQEYNPATNSWQQKIFADGLHLSVNDATAIGIGNKGYICYGNKKDIVSYKPSTNQVENLGDLLNLGNNRNNPISFALGDSVYFGTGYYGFMTATYTNDIQSLYLPINYPPTDIQLSFASFAENLPDLSAISTLSTIDKNSNDSFTYELVVGEGSDDNTYFTIEGNQLKAYTQNFEAKNELKIRVKTIDSEGDSFEKGFVLTVTDMNDPITEIGYIGYTIYENMPLNTVVANLQVFDEDSQGNHSFELVDGIGSDDNNAFSIDGYNLLSGAEFNYEFKSKLYYRIKAIDEGNSSMERSFEVIINNVNEAPTDILLSNDTVFVSDMLGTVVGVLNVEDEDMNDSHTFEFTSDTQTNLDDTKYYTITGHNLVVNKTITTDKQLHELLIKASDLGGLTITCFFAILVKNDLGIKLLVEASEAFNIYPNPVRGFLHIKALNPVTKVQQVKVLDATGKIVFSNESVNLTKGINLSRLTTGNYFVVIATAEKIYYKKISIE